MNKREFEKATKLNIINKISEIYSRKPKNDAFEYVLGYIQALNEYSIISHKDYSILNAENNMLSVITKERNKCHMN